VDNLNIDEMDLVKSVVKWGEFQLKKVPKQSAKLRDKILPVLPLIRFVGMSQEDVAKVCVQELAQVLTADEKLQIMQSSLLKDEELLPPTFTKSPARRKRIETPEIPEIPRRQVHLVHLPYKKYKQIGNYEQRAFCFRMEFWVDQWATLVGLNLASGTAKSGTFFFTVFRSNSGKALAHGDSETILDHISTGHCLKVTPEIVLHPLSYISIQFTFPLIGNRSGLLSNHFALQELTSSHGSPKVTLIAGMDVLFPIRSLVFDGPKVS